MASSAFDDAVDAYLRDCERRGLRPATLRYYRMVLGRFGALCAPMAPGDLSLASVRALQDRSPQLSPGSVRGFLRALKTFAGWLTDEGLLPADPLVRLLLPRVDTRPMVMPTDQEVAAVLYAGNMRILICIGSPLDRSYDAQVPNKTIYVSDGDLATFQRAQELAGDNLSAAIAAALRRYVEVEEGRREGFDEIIVGVGPGKGRKVRFSGVLIGEWVDSNLRRLETFRVYRGRSGKFVLHIERSPDYTMVDAEGQPAGWRGHLGIGSVSYGSSPGESSLEVVESLDELRERIPRQLYDIVAGVAQRPAVEDLDI